MKTPGWKNLFGVSLLAGLVLASVFAPQAQAVKDEKNPDADSIRVSGKGNNLTFKLKDADIKSVLQVFANQLGINIVAGDDVNGKISFSFTNVKPREGLEAVLRAKGYDWFQEGDTLVVSNKNTVRTYLLEYANATEIKAALDLLAEPGDSISVNDSYNALIVNASTKNIARLEKAIQDLDVPPTQVMVETRIVEIKYDDQGQAGISASYTKAGVNTSYSAQTSGFGDQPASDGSSVGFYAQVISGNVEAFMSTFLNKTNYSLLSAPRITTINNKTATILIGSKIGYKTAVITTTGTVYTVNFLTTGTSLAITPHVGEGGFIRMMLMPQISEGSVSDDQPVEDTTQTQSEVLVKDGQTVVIGGLTKSAATQADYGIPFLMDIPLIGGIFRRTSVVNSKIELMIFVTPHILTPEYLTQLDEEGRRLNEKQQSEGAGLIH